MTTPATIIGVLSDVPSEAVTEYAVDGTIEHAVTYVAAMGDEALAFVTGEDGLAFTRTEVAQIVTIFTSWLDHGVQPMFDHERGEVL